MSVFINYSNIWKPITVFAKSSILEAWQGSKYSSDWTQLKSYWDKNYMVFIKYLENIKMTKNKPCIRWKQAENLFFTVDLFPTTTVNNWSPVYIWHENKVGFCIMKYWNSVFFFTKHHHILMIVTKSLWEKSVFSNYQLWWPKWYGSYFH